MGIIQLNDILVQIKAQLQFLLPEILLCLGIIFNITFDLISPKFKKWSPYWALLVVLGILIVEAGFEPAETVLFQGHWKSAYFTSSNKMLVLVATALFLLLFNTKEFAHSTLEKSAEYITLVLSVALGAMVIISSTHYLLVILAFELISICSYLLTVFKQNKKSREAAMKYLIFGLVSAGLLFYGVSLIFFHSGSLLLLNPETLPATTGVISLGIVLVFMAIAFKLSAAPMHFWAPDVYHGISYPLIALISTLPKIGVFVLLYHFCISYETIELFNRFSLQDFIAIVALISIVIGNAVALFQTNVKRLIAYSSIAHSGFFLIGFVTGTFNGILSASFYLWVYVFMQIAFVLGLLMATKISGSDELKSFSGIGRKYPELGVLMFLIVIALVGLPPTVGFTAKLLVFSSLWEVLADQKTLYTVLFAVGLINTAVGLFYYIKIPFFMFLRDNNALTQVKFSLQSRVLLWFLCMLLIVLFFASELVLTKLQTHLTLEGVFK